MDRVAQRLAQYTWAYADQDPSALREIGLRVAGVGRIEDLITYSELATKIDFQIPTVNKGAPLRLGVPEWTDLHRAIIGDFLGRLCVDTYTLGEFMGSAFAARARRNSSHIGFPKRAKRMNGTRNTLDVLTRR